MIRIWNFNKSRIHAARGARNVLIKLDEKVICDIKGVEYFLWRNKESSGEFEGCGVVLGVDNVHGG